MGHKGLRGFANFLVNLSKKTDLILGFINRRIVPTESWRLESHCLEVVQAHIHALLQHPLGGVTEILRPWGDSSCR